MAWWPWDTKRAALLRQREDFERTLIVLREENSLLRRLLEAAHRRSDQQAADLTRALTTAPPARPPLTAPAEAPRRTSKDPLGVGSLFEPVDYKHPEATFTSADAAALMYAEDEGTDGVSAAA
jgi:hypothetical protein